MSLGLWVGTGCCLIVNSMRRVGTLATLIALACVLTAHAAVATTFTTTVPGTSITIPTTYPQAGGVVIVMEGANGNVYYQFVNPSTMFQGYQNTGTPAAWQGNPFQIGPVMSLNCGPVVSCSTYLGGSATRMSIRFTAYDGDSQAGMFDFNDLSLQINGSNFGANSGNWSTLATQNTNTAGTTLISSSTGFGNNTFDTGWFQSTDAAILSNVLSTGTITARVFDKDPNDNYWDFKQGADAVTSVVPLNVAPGVTLDKASTTTSFTAVGQVIPYTFTYRNVGSVWINTIAVSDPKVTGVSCPAPPAATTANLDPAEQVVCTANYTVTQADIDAGSIINTATATGTPQAGSLGPVTDTNTIPGPVATPSIDLVKTATPSPFGAVGSTITYAFSIQNTGNVTLSSVVITDPRLPSLSCTISPIAPGVTVNAACTGNTLAVTQSFVDAGSVSNTATVTSRSPSNAVISDTSSVVLTGPAQVRSLFLDKTSPTANYNAVGAVLSYSYLLRNTGNVTLTGALSVTDNKTTVSCPSFPPAGLAPNATLTCTANYPTTLADMNAGSVVNTANASIGSTVAPSDQVTIPAVQLPALLIDKTSPTSNYSSVGSVLSYSYLVRNTGNVTLTNAITVSDNKTSVTCPALPGGGLIPNATITCTASYTVTQADIDAGSVVNTASAATTFGAGNTAVVSATDQVTVPAIKSPALSIVKNATAINFTNVGDTVSYSYLVTNTGNTTLTTAVSVTDNRVATVNCPALPVGGLAPGAAITCTSTYSVLIGDLDLGSVTNIASAASGTTQSPQVAITVPTGASPALTIDKTSTSTTFNNVGDVIPYSFLLTNSGDTTLTRAINVNDNKIGSIACWVPPTTGPPANRVFTPGQTKTCTANYTVTQADLDAGFVTNQASAATTYGAANVPVVSPPDSLTVNAIQNPSLDVTKAVATLPVSAVGQVLTYTVSARNSGDVTLSSITITDPLIPTMNCTVASLAVGISTNCVGSYTVKQSDFDSGSIANTATATASTPQGAPVSDTGTNTVNITQVSSVSIAKAYTSNADQDASSSISLNDTLTYTVTVSNDGNVTQSNVVVTDALLTPSSQTCASVAPGGTCVLVGTLNVTQAHVNAGTVGNTAGVTTTLLPTSETVSRSVTVPQISTLSLDKQTPVNGDQDGSNSITKNDVLTYTVVATNTGNVTQSNVTVADAQLIPASTVCSLVAPGGTCTLVGTKTVTQANVDAGTIVNTANVTSILVTTPVTDSVTTPVAQNSSLSIAKANTANADEDTSGTISRNDTLTYNVTVTNDGTVTQNNVVVSDAKLTPSSTTCAAVAPGDTCILTGTLIVSQANVNAARIDNTGSVTSTLLPTAETVTLNTPVPQFRELSLDKTSNTANFDAVNDVVSYNYLLTNTGNVTLTGVVSVSDDKTTVSCPILPVGGLLPGATHTCSATYTPTQTNLNAGFVLNTATATIGSTTSAPDQVSVPALQLPALTVDKTSPTPSFDSVGDVLTYSYIVRNSGNVTLTSAITVTDDKTTVTCPTMPVGGLNPTATLSCSATYTVTQADIDAGAVINSAFATSGSITSSTDQVTVPAVQTPGMTAIKNATAVAFTQIGDTVSYEYIVTNTGNTTLTSPITVSDNRISPINCPAMPVGGLAPGATYTCTANYSVVVEDLDIGTLTNLASATSGSTTSPMTSETIPAGSNPALSIVKSSTATSFDNLGEVVPYSFLVTNSGNATFTRLINVTDDKIGTIACWSPSAGDLTFSPSETHTCTANYIVTQADLDRGFVTNQASAATTYGTANIPVTSPPDGLTVNAIQDPGLNVTKAVATLPVAAVGQVLTYTITAENSGDVTLSNVEIKDPLIPAMSCIVASLSPGLSTNCAGTYSVTQADFDAGTISNTATATASTPQGSPVTDTGTNSVPITQVSSVSIAKTFSGNADQDSSGTVSLGDALTYTITLTNDGNVTQNTVVVADALLTPATKTCSTVLPGGTCVLVGTLNVTQVHVDAGSVANTASVTTALLPTAETASRTVSVPQVSSLGIDKQTPVNGDQDNSGTVTLNDVLTYTVVVTNTGNVTQNAVTVSDSQLSPATQVCASVAPGAACTLIGTKTVSQAEVDAGTIVNSASVTSALIPIAVTDSVTTPVAQTSSLAVVKANTANADEDSSASISLNDTLTYKVTMTNDGTVTQNNVVVSDAQLTPASVNCAAVLPGNTCVLTGTYTVTQANVDAGTIGNTGSVTSTLLPVPETVTINTSVFQNPALTIDKTSSTSNFDAVGDVVSYSYVLSNSGNVTLTGAVSVTDDKTTVACPALPIGGLAPGATLTCSASYNATQVDLNTGFVLNTASATIGTTTSATDQVNVPALQLPALTIDKTSSTTSYNNVGDVLSYSYIVTNSGNVSLTSAITVNDDKVTVTCPALAIGGLVPASSITCSASHTVTQADIDAGAVINTASAASGSTTSPTDQVTVPAVQAPAMTVVKNATAVAFTNIGDTVSYEYIVTNSGNTTVTAPITVIDNRVSPVNCPALPVGGLAPGASHTCTGDYTVTVADLDLGSITNLASATSGSTTSPQTSETVPAGAAPALTIDKTSSLTTVNNVGDVIPYSFLVTNSGNASFTRPIIVVDDKIGTITCWNPVASDLTFTPSETQICAANYTVTQADLDAGFVTNQANAATTYGAANAQVTSPPDSVTVNAAQSPGLEVTKSATTLPVTAVGQVLTYNVAAKNTGNITLSNVNITDPLIPLMNCTVASLAVGATTNCIGTYAVTQADFNAGQINNTATATASTPQGAPVNETGALITMTAAAAPALTMLKDASPSSFAAVGDIVTYRFTVTNSGDVTVNNITVTDPLVPSFSCVIATLAPNANDNSCTTSYAVKQTDINTGSVYNTAAASGISVRGTNPSTTASKTVPGPVRSPEVTVAKSASPLTYGAVGDVISYDYLVTNTGNVSLTGAISISDDKLSGVSCPALPIAGLLPGESHTCTASHTIVLADLNAGSITNQAIANSNSVLGPLSSAPDTATVNAVPAPAIAVVKSASSVSDLDGNGADAGDSILYSFVISNEGNVTLTSVGVTDAKVGTVSCPVTTLDPGTNTTCTATYILTLADVNAGKVENTAEAGGSPPSGPVVKDVSGATKSDDTQTVTPITGAAAIAIVKTAGAILDGDGNGADAGDTIDYAFTVSNEGNVTLTSVGIVDPKVGAVTCPVTSLDPGASTICSATYTLIQADINAGKVTNTAIVSSFAPDDSAVSDTSGNAVSDDTPTVTPITQSPGIAVTKSAAPITDLDANGPDAGDTIDYSFTVSNEGNVTLTSIGVTDPNVGPVLCAVSSLTPTTSTTCSATYILTQADVDAGQVQNSAIASGTTPTGTQVNDTSGSSIGDDAPTISNILQTPALAVAKTSPTPSFDSVGDVLTYSYEVRNIGNVTITNPITISDDKTSVVCPALPAGLLLPQATLTCSATYSIVQADLDAGDVVNTASAATTFGPGNSVVTSPSDQATVPAVQSPAMTVVKNATSVNFTNIGDIVSYEYIVTNTGNTSIVNPVTVTDNRVSPVNCPALPGAGLAPGASLTCTADYTVVVDDLDVGTITNLASSTDGVTTSPVTSKTVPAGSTQALTISKTSTSTSFDAVGDVVPYSFLLTNSGNATFTRAITVVDDKIGNVACFAPTPGDLTFTPGETINCSGNYTIVQADLDLGFVTNEAYAETTYGAANIPVTSAPDALTINAIQNPELTVSKSATTLPVSAVNQVLTYTVTVENSGDVTLSNVNISDPLIPAMSCTVASLAPAATANCIGTYTVTQADFDAGKILNTAVASASTPQGAPVSGSGSNTLNITQTPSMAVVKSAGSIVDKDGNGPDAGDEIGYSFTVSNEGNVTLSAIAITDVKIGTVNCPVTSIAPGLSTVCTATYVLSLSDVNAGEVVNTATVAAQSPSAAPVSDTSGSAIGNDTPTTTSIPASPLVALVKSAAPISDLDGNGPDAGDTIAYSFAVSNEGNQTLTSLGIVDAKLGAVNCPVTTLAPAANTTCTATYTLTQTDIDAGGVTNTATASAQDPKGASVSDISGSAIGNDTPTLTLIPRTSGLTLVKFPGVLTDIDGNGADQGDTLTYSFTVSNSGNQTLSNVVVTDNKGTMSGGPIASLAPAAADSTTFKATYILTQSDVDAGSVPNTALARGNPPTGPPVTDTSGTAAGNDTPTDTAVTRSPALTLVKTAKGINDLDGNGPDAGDTVSYDFDVENTGNVTLTNISVNDPLVGVAALERANDVSTLVAMSATGIDPMATASTSHLVQEVGVDQKQSLPAQVSALLFGGADVPELPTGLHVQRKAVRLSNRTGNIIAGENIGFYYTVTNTGAGPLTNVAAEQGGVEGMGSNLELLSPNTSDVVPMVFAYTVQESDVVAGLIEQSARVTAKSRTQIIETEVNDKIAFTDIALTSELLTGSISPASIPTLAPGATTRFSGTYQLTQSDIDAGTLSNTAVATGAAPGGGSASDRSGTLSSNDLPTDINIPRSPAVALVKTAGSISDGDGNGPDAGDTIAYDFEVSNQGNVTLSAIAISDAKIGTVTCPQTTIAPATTVMCTATYALTQTDVDAGQVTNTAEVQSTAPGGALVKDTSGSTTSDDTPTLTAIPRDGGMTLVKTAGSPTVTAGIDAGVADADDTIEYSFTVQNIGNVTLTPIVVSDAKVPAIVCPVNTLLPTESTICLGKYTLTLADFDQGSVENTATTTGGNPDGTTSTDTSGTDATNDLPTITNLPQTPAMTLVKTAADPTTAAGANATLVDANDTIEYTFTVANTGNVTLTGIAVNDAKVPTITCLATSLAPGISTDCTGTYQLSQTDLDAGTVQNTALVTGNAPNGTPTEDTSGTDGGNDLPTDKALPQVALIAVVKTASPINDIDGNGVDVDDTIEYAFAVTNQGNVTLTAVAVADDKVTEVVCTQDTLAPAETINCTATYTLKQEDIDRGQVENQATASGTPPSGAPVTDLSDPQTPGQGPGENDKTITSLTQTPALTLVKLVDVSKLQTPAPQPGDKVTYSFAIKNTGNVTLTDITLADPLPNLVVSGTKIDKLAPGNVDATTFSATYTITAADISQGFVENSAIANGNFKDVNEAPQTTADISGIDETNDTKTVVLLKAVPSIRVVKSATFNDVTAPIPGANLGDTITYSFEVSNTGNVALSDVGVVDTMLAGISCVDTSLTVGQKTTCSANDYVLTQSDINTGEVRNQAIANATALVDGEVSGVSGRSGTAGGNTDPTITNLPIPKPTFTKTANNGTAKIGDALTFTIKATTVVFSPADVIDQLPGGLSYVKGSSTVNGAALEPVISGKRLTFANIVPVNGEILITLTAMVNASAKDGKMTNTAQLFHPNGSVLATAKATVEIRPEPVFDCGDIIGKVFDDRNHNGIQDAETSPYEPERGIPNVRVVTVNGVLITTDKHGRFHIPCADIPDKKIGANFILKLDPRSLPSGYRMTTENPKVVRLTRGKMSKLNFGATISRVIRLDLTDTVFTAGGLSVSPKLKSAVGKLVGILDEEQSTVRLQYHVGAEGKAIASRRLKLIEDYIASQWQQQSGRYKLPIETRLVHQDQKASN
jgi:uncharacterized repeat protein (TIGR01451 family)